MQAPETSSIQGRGDVSLSAQGIYETSLIPKHRLGERLAVGERVFYYARATEALMPSKLCTALVTVESRDTVPTAHGMGIRAVSAIVTVAREENVFAEGYLGVDFGVGAGDFYKIKGNSAQPTAGQAMTVHLYDGLLRAWSKTGTDTIIYSSVFNAQESNIDQVEMPLGVPLVSVPLGHYFWIATWGSCLVLIGRVFGGLVSQRLVTIGSITPGSVENFDAIGEPIVGMVVLDGAAYEAGKYQQIMLMTMP